MDATIRGNLGAEPDVFRREDKTRTRLRVAAEQSLSEREAGRPTVWVDVETWDGLAERCAAVLTTGHPVIVIGRWVTDEWTDKEGQKRSKTYVKARAVGPDLSRAEVSSVERIKAAQPTGAAEQSPVDEESASKAAAPSGDEQPERQTTPDPFEED